MSVVKLLEDAHVWACIPVSCARDEELNRSMVELLHRLAEEEIKR